MAGVDGVRYDLPLYEQITKATSASIFSKAVRFLIEYHLYKVQLPQEVREAFINDITEIYYRKFGYVSTMDEGLAHTLAEYFLQNDVRVAPDSGRREPDCTRLEYPFDGARMRIRNKKFPYRKEVPIDHLQQLGNFDGYFSQLYDNRTPEEEMIAVEGALDIKEAIELADLSELEEELLWLNVVVGMSVRDIASLDEKYPSKSTAATIIRDAKEKLRKAVLKKYEK